MTQGSRRSWPLILAFTICCLCAGARPASAQTMSFSEYDDASANADGSTLYVTLTGYDESSGCSHSSYHTGVWFYNPSGGYNYAEADGLSGNVSLSYDGEGDYPVSYATTYICSCVMGPATFGGSLTWHYGIKHTFYTDATYHPDTDTCTYASFACTSGTPTCGEGKGILAFLNQCPVFEEIAWLIAQKGTTVKCLVGLVYARNSGGACS